MTYLFKRRLTFIALLSLAWSFMPATMLPAALGQGSRSMQSTALIVDGNVENVYQSGNEHLIQILVQRSEVPRLDALADANYPAPGQYIYAHVSETRDRAGRLSGDHAMPQVKSRVRAYLAVGQSGRWQTSGDDWFEENPSDDSPAGGGTPQPIDQGIGISAQRVTVGDQIVLKVVRVTPDSPAADSGIEPGDILVEANRVPLESESQLADAYRESRGEFSLTVRDVRTGRDVPIKVATRSPNASSGSMPSNRGMQALGATTELAFLSGEAVVKVTEVKPDSPAARSGLQAGLLILNADGKSIQSPADLTAAEQASKGRMELIVVDPKDKEKSERKLRVSL